MIAQSGITMNTIVPENPPTSCYRHGARRRARRDRMKLILIMLGVGTALIGALLILNAMR